MNELREKDTGQCGIAWKEFREFFKQRKESFFVCVVVVEQLLSLREKQDMKCDVKVICLQRGFGSYLNFSSNTFRLLNCCFIECDATGGQTGCHWALI